MESAAPLIKIPLRKMSVPYQQSLSIFIPSILINWI
jgi:hypothetical protein